MTLYTISNTCVCIYIYIDISRAASLQAEPRGVENIQLTMINETHK